MTYTYIVYRQNIKFANIEVTAIFEQKDTRIYLIQSLSNVLFTRSRIRTRAHHTLYSFAAMLPTINRLYKPIYQLGNLVDYF